jgi:hypothetical protein
MTNWQERKFFSMQHDCTMARISGFDDRQQEHWLMIETGKGYAERRTEAIGKLRDAIVEGHIPGELKGD